MEKAKEEKVVKVNHFKDITEKVKKDIKECRSRNAYDVDDAAQLAGYVQAYADLKLITDNQCDTLFKVIGVAEAT